MILRVYREAFRGLPREVWLLSLVLFVNRAGTMVVPFLSLYLTTQCGYSVGTAGAILALFGVGGLARVQVGGRLADRFGPVPVQAASLTGAAGTFFVLGALDRGPALAAAVLVLGFLAEAYRPASAAAIAGWSPPGRRTRAFALARLAGNAGMTVGPALGGLLASRDYGLLFGVDGGTSLLAALVLVAGLGRHRVESAPAEPSGRSGRASPWRDRTLLLVLGLLFLQAVVFFQFLSTMPLYLRDALGFGESAVGFVLAVNTVTILAFEMILIRAVEGRDPLRLVALASALVGVGFGLLARVHGHAGVVVAVLIWTVGEMLSAPSTSAWVADRAPAGGRGSYLAAYVTAFSLALVAAPTAGTWVYERAGGEGLWDACLGLGLLVAAGFWGLARVSPNRDPENP